MRTLRTETCAHCRNKFSRRTGRFHAPRKDKRYFCSNACLYASMTTRVETACNSCGRTITKTPDEIRKSKSGNIFCSRSCAATFNNAKREKSRRSKIEIEFFNLLVEHYPKLQIKANDKEMLNGFEVDVAIPEIKLAIEWNGAVHFKPMYGIEKLLSIQNRDAKKLRIATERDVNLVVIADGASTKAFLHKQFIEVCNIIDALLIK